MQLTLEMALKQTLVYYNILLYFLVFFLALLWAWRGLSGKDLPKAAAAAWLLDGLFASLPLLSVCYCRRNVTRNATSNNHNNNN